MFELHFNCAYCVRHKNGRREAKEKQSKFMNIYFYSFDFNPEYFPLQLSIVWGEDIDL